MTVRPKNKYPFHELSASCEYASASWKQALCLHNQLVKYTIFTFRNPNMDTRDILDETSADENPLSVYAGKKARHTGLWMAITSAAGIVLFGGLTLFFIGDMGFEADRTEEIVLLVFFMGMTFKYGLLFASAVQTRMGAGRLRVHFLHKAAFNARIVWVFVGILASVFLLQVILYWTTGFKMFGDITSELFHVY